MGGLHGHINHLYDDRDLTFKQLQQVFLKLSSGELSFTEKFDGINLYFSYELGEEQLKYCRNKSDLSSDGVSIEDLLERYPEPPLNDIFSDAHKILGSFIESLSFEEKKQLFSSLPFYNIEILHPKFDSIIKYSQPQIIIHLTGHIGLSNFDVQLGLINKKSKEKVLVNPQQNIKLEESSVKDLINKLKEIMASNKLKSSNTIDDFLNKKLYQVVSSLNLNRSKQKMLVRKLSGKKGVRLANLYSSLEEKDKKDIEFLLDKKKLILSNSLEPIKSLINDFKELLLREYKPVLNKKEINKEKIKIEGIVFAFEGKQYKLTGKYADEIREKNLKPVRKKVALIPGAFKPPHKGHLAMFEHYARVCDEVLVVCSSQPREASSGRIFTLEETVDVLREFISLGTLENVKFIFDENPHKKIISLLEDREVLSENSDVYLGASTKNKDYNKASYIYTDRDDINILSTKETSYSIKEDLNASELRDYIELGEVEKVKRFIPERVEVDRYLEIFNMKDMNIADQKKKTMDSSSLLDEVLKVLIKEKPIEEMSSAGGGSVAGASGAFGMKKIKREELVEEIILRKSIRGVIKKLQEQKKRQEEGLRKVIRKLLLEKQVSDGDPAPSQFTGINVLEDLLKKIVPVLEIDYKKMTTSQNQRVSFRAHVVNGIENLLKPVEVSNDAGDDQGREELDQDQFIDVLEEDDVNVTIGGDSEEKNEKFIDVSKKKEKSSEEKKEEEVNSFTLSGQDLTGRNMAYSTFKKISSNIIDSYDVLSDDKDKKMFFDYLITNVKLYFDKFEDELSPSVEEPSTPEYDQEQGGEKL